MDRVLGVPRRRLALLHLAPEPCLQRRLAALPNIRYRAIDLYDRRIAQRMDASALAFPDESFDLVICCHVLEHVADDKRAIAEITRVLRPGGRALIMVPLDPARWSTFEDARIRGPAARFAAYGHPYHYRICGRDYGARLAVSGLTVTEVPSVALSGHFRRFHRINKTRIFDYRRPSGLKPVAANKSGSTRQA